MADGTAPLPTSPASQSWAAGAKDAVITSLSARVWATVGQGILNEVFWPAVDQPQVKDLGFLVLGPPGWREIKAVNEYTLVPPEDPAVPIAHIVHSGEFYRLVLRVVADPRHDAVLIGYELAGTDAGRAQKLCLYPLLAPHMGRSTVTDSAQVPLLGTANTAWVDSSGLFARDGANGCFLCLLSDSGFSRASVGYQGDSDGWTDLHRHDAMTWEYSLAGPGTVALTGELVAKNGTRRGTLALGFGNSAQAARNAAQGGLDAGIGAAAEVITRQWSGWADGLATRIGGPADEDIQRAVRQSAAVLRAHEDRDRPGAFVAGLATPWGDQTNDPGGYHVVWCRDSCESALALAALGDSGAGQRLLEFLTDLTHSDPGYPAARYWKRCYFLDGTAMEGLQLDEVAFPVLLAAKLRELGSEFSASTRQLVRQVVAYLVRNGPVRGEDRWEESHGASPFTLATQIVALVAAADTLGGEERDYALRLADNWNERLEEFTYVDGGLLDRAFGTAGHYVRIGEPPEQVRLGNQPDRLASVSSEIMVGLDFLYLVRLGLRHPMDPRVTDTLRVVDHMLTRTLPTGEAFCRYDMDGYGEWIDGRGWPLWRFGIGRPWPLLCGERGHYEMIAGNSTAAMRRLRQMLALRGRGGLLPEQVWDSDPLPWRNLAPGKPTGSAMPLAWAHSELIKLAVTLEAGKNRAFEHLDVIARRYPGAQTPTTTGWHWRTHTPVRRLPAGCELVVEDPAPFTLHFGFDGWSGPTIAERPAQAQPFGMYAVRFTPAELDGHGSVQFTRRYPEGRWEGTDNTVALGAVRAPAPSLPLPAREWAGLPRWTPNGGQGPPTAPDGRGASASPS